LTSYLCNKAAMNPQELFCPNLDCPSRGQAGKGNIIGHGKKKRRYKCTLCNKTFVQTACTALYRLHKDPQVFFQVTTLLALGCPPHAAAVAFDLDPRTVSAWLKRAGEQAKRVHQHLVVGQARDLGQVQADEIRVKMQASIAWMAIAIAVPWRLWLGGVLSASRDKNLIAALAALVRACALLRPLLICFDGFKSYVSCFHRAFRVATPTGGRPRLVPWLCLCLGQVVKIKERGRVVGVQWRLVQGAKEVVEALLFGAKGINTAYIERLNATFRARLFALVRRGRCLLRLTETIELGMYLVGAFYNFCTPHQSLRLECREGGCRCKWQERTPAMAAGIAQQCWSMAELLTFRVPPPRWQPPKRRGRRSKEMQALIERWAT
jgi:transposase-like protein